MHIGNAIKKLRHLQDLTQEAMANDIGKTKGLISQIEKTGKVNYYTLIKIAKTLKTTPDKIEEYQESLILNTKQQTNSPPQNKLPEIDYLLLENQHLKDQIKLLKKNIILLEQKSS